MGTKPYTCPICNGTTAVEKGFYPDEPERTQCKACVNGIIFGASDELTWTPIPFNPPDYRSSNQCSLCGTWYTGTHQCMGKFWTTPTYHGGGYTYGSNPPSVTEVEGQLGIDYLSPGAV